MIGARITDPDIRRLRALQMLQLKLTGHSMTAIAERFNVRSWCVKDELLWAKQQGLVQAAEDRILTELVPEALNAVKAALVSGNVDAALEVLKGIGLLGKNKQPFAPQASEESLEVHVTRITSNVNSTSFKSIAERQAGAIDSRGPLPNTPQLPPAAAPPVESHRIEDSPKDIIEGVVEPDDVGKSELESYLDASGNDSGQED